MIPEKLAKNNTSGYKGVSYHSASDTWQAVSSHRGINKSLGYYHTPEQASRYYNMYNNFVVTETMNIEDPEAFKAILDLCVKKIKTLRKVEKVLLQLRDIISE